MDRTRPAAGNHDLAADGGAAYWDLFGDRAGGVGDGWYSYDIGEWHVVVLNSNCDRVACDIGSAQHDWLMADLAAADADCTLAYWHHPRFSSGKQLTLSPGSYAWSFIGADGAELDAGTGSCHS